MNKKTTHGTSHERPNPAPSSRAFRSPHSGLQFFTECLILVTCLCRLKIIKTGPYKGWWRLDKPHAKNTQSRGVWGWPSRRGREIVCVGVLSVERRVDVRFWGAQRGSPYQPLLSGEGPGLWPESIRCSQTPETPGSVGRGWGLRGTGRGQSMLSSQSPPANDRAPHSGSDLSLILQAKKSREFRCSRAAGRGPRTRRVSRGVMRCRWTQGAARHTRRPCVQVAAGMSLACWEGLGTELRTGFQAWLLHLRF